MDICLSIANGLFPRTQAGSGGSGQLYRAKFRGVYRHMRTDQPGTDVPTAIGAEEVHQIVQKDEVGGATFCFEMSKAAVALTGYDVGVIRSSDHTHGAQEAINAFNDPTNDLKILVANIWTLPYGVNLHHVCYHGILANLSSSHSLLLQIEKRLVRINQAYIVKWWIVKTKNTYHDYQERDRIARCLFQSVPVFILKTL
ncbi:hypothetical protein V2G26_000679 [Clonostachys chloroleuca]